jgi:hypothetical protein
MMASRSSSRRPQSRAPATTLSRTDMVGNGLGRWNSIPTVRRRSTGSTSGSYTFLPSSSTCPLTRPPGTSSWSRLIVRSTVDFPHPEGPMSAAVGATRHTCAARCTGGGPGRCACAGPVPRRPPGAARGSTTHRAPPTPRGPAACRPGAAVARTPRRCLRGALPSSSMATSCHRTSAWFGGLLPGRGPVVTADGADGPGLRRTQICGCRAVGSVRPSRPDEVPVVDRVTRL